MFRRNQTNPNPSERPEPETIAIDLTELAALERALLEADRLRRSWMEPHPYYGMHLLTVHDVIGLLHQRVGAASVVQPDPQRARIPLYRHEFKWLTDAIIVMEGRWARDGVLSDARTLHCRFNMLLGQSRAIIHMGGTSAFASEPPQAAPCDASATVRLEVQRGIPERRESRSS